MTALAKDRKTDAMDVNSPIPRLLSIPVAAATTIYAGAMVATNSAGYAVPASANSAQKLWGRAERTVTNTSAAGFGNAADLYVEVRTGVYFFNNGTGANAIGLANVGAACFASDDNTVNLTDNAGTWPYAGVVYPGGSSTNLRSTGSGEVAVLVGMPSAYSLNPEASTGTAPGRARCVVTANTSLSAFAGVTGGSSTNSDGVLAVAGDVVLLAAQTTATQNGPYVVGTVTAGTAPLTRPDWFATGNTIPTGYSISLGGEGTVYKNTVWHAMISTASTFVVDTTDGKFYPRQVTWTSALVAGIATAGASATSGAPATAFVLSANTNCAITRKTPNTSSATIQYNMNTAGVTPGVGAAGAFSVFATVAAGTVNASDVSTVIVTYFNEI